jgi:hypothetical protein
MGDSIGDEGRVVTGNPLQSCILVEAFDEEIKTFYQSAELMPNSLLKLDMLGLYRRFIVRKYDIYQEEKFQVDMNNVVAVGQQEHDLKKA